MKWFFQTSRRPPFFQSALIYSVQGKLLIVPSARTRNGVNNGMAIVGMANPTDPVEIGAQVLAMLAKCKDGIPDGREPSPSIAVLLKATKLRSWRRFHQQALAVSISHKPGTNELKAAPLRRQGGGSVGVDDKDQISSLDTTEIGIAVMKTFEFAE